MAPEKTTANTDIESVTTEPDRQRTTPNGTDGPTSATIAATRQVSDATVGDGDRWNTLTIIGQGSPSSFELTVDGEIELTDGDRDEDVTILSGSTVEGTIETGMVSFRFTGDLTDVTFVDRGITGQEPATTPNVHVDYGVSEQS
ncbi:hypothetical protein [Natrinema halophilum]|uniref:hypothetical protein n=1 Tax=Natrinema halophilum TaxID=1699371 RepID=UPI001F165241|nr:hypothetical protein [Natrinema halophilum]UHQ96051.1 hypothetical protein HYG82_06100 [Natrinema halophilum]